MNNKLRTWLVILAAMISVYSCKEPVLDGGEFLPDVDNLNVITTDTLTILSKTIREDSLRSDNLTINPLGSMEDAVFGKTFASIYTQIRIPSNNVDLGDQLVLDSAVLMLDYAGSYGDENIPQDFVVYRITEEMAADEQYQSHQEFTTDGMEIGRLSNHVPNLSDSISTIDGKFPAHMRIKLDDAFGAELLNQSGTTNTLDNTAWLDYLKGLYIVSDTSKPGESVIYLDMQSPVSRLTLYYSNSENDSLSFSFLINDECAIVSNYKHRYQGYPINDALQSNAKSDSVLYIQSLAGSKSKLFVPYIKKLGNISINRALLRITQLSGYSASDSGYSAPAQLTVTDVDSLGRNDFLIDILEGTSYFGGVREDVDINGTTVAQYEFNLARHMQLLANDEIPDYGLHLLSFPSTRIGDRLVVGGGGSGEYQMQLVLTYTKIE